MTLFHHVYQTRFGKAGNCWQACVASLLCLQLYEVPDFVHRRWPQEKNETESRWEYVDGVPQNPFWWQDFTAWLKSRGLAAVRVDYPTTKFVEPTDGRLYIMSGPSPRGNGDHAVIGCVGVLFHDPHPDQTGILRVEEFCFIVPEEEAKW